MLICRDSIWHAAAMASHLVPPSALSQRPSTTSPVHIRTNRRPHSPNISMKSPPTSSLSQSKINMPCHPSPRYTFHPGPFHPIFPCAVLDASWPNSATHVLLLRPSPIVHIPHVSLFRIHYSTAIVNGRPCLSLSSFVSCSSSCLSPHHPSHLFMAPLKTERTSGYRTRR